MLVSICLVSVPTNDNKDDAMCGINEDCCDACTWKMIKYKNCEVNSDPADVVSSCESMSTRITYHTSCLLITITGIIYTREQNPITQIPVAAQLPLFNEARKCNNGLHANSSSMFKHSEK